MASGDHLVPVRLRPAHMHSAVLRRGINISFEQFSCHVTFVIVLYLCLVLLVGVIDQPLNDTYVYATSSIVYCGGRSKHVHVTTNLRIKK